MDPKYPLVSSRFEIASGTSSHRTPQPSLFNHHPQTPHHRNLNPKAIKKVESERTDNCNVSSATPIMDSRPSSPDVSRPIPTVEAMVAIISAAGGQSARENKHRDIPSRSSSNGISHDFATNDRFREVLDALASLCVSQARVQVISIGFQLDEPRSQLILSIADNVEIKEATTDHLKSVWRTLHLLSDLYAGQRSQSGHFSGVPWDQYVGTSPDVPRFKRAAALIENLGELVYVFTKAKHAKRVCKWWDPENNPVQPKKYGGEPGPLMEGLLAFARKFQAQKGKHLEGNDGKFERLVFFLRDAFRCLRAEKVHWGTLIQSMDKATELGIELLEERPCWWETLVDSICVVVDSENKFPLRRAIDRLISHHRYFRALVSFAHSPRLRPAFEHHMKLNPVPVSRPPGHIDLPASVESWKCLLDQICNENNNPLDDDGAQSLLTTLMKNYGNRPSTMHRVHSECALVAYYDQLRGSKGYTPAFPYIGVSKLSCKPCNLWLSAYNSRPAGGPKFFTRGSHGKWYFPWSAPVVEGITPIISAQMSRECVAYLDAQGLLRCGSDSTVASGKSRFETDPQVEEQLEQKAKTGLDEDF